MWHLMCGLVGHRWYFDDVGSPHKDKYECSTCKKRIPAALNGEYRTDIECLGNLFRNGEYVREITTTPQR